MKEYFKEIILSLFLVFMAGMCNAAMDITTYHYQESVFPVLHKDNYFNPQYSWANKWAKDQYGRIVVGQERFWGSSRYFVMVTDFWHLMKAQMILFLALAIVSYKRLNQKALYKMVDFVLLYTCFTISFTIFYEYIFSA